MLPLPAPLQGPVLVIINPVSGPKRRGSAAERVELARRTFDRLGVRGDIHLTERQNHAYDLAKDAVQAGTSLVIAWGGDGTINEVARAVVSTSTALGMVPGGSGNGLSRDFRIPFDPARALERALRAPERMLDAGEIGGRLFVNIAGIGLDAHVAGAVATRIHHRGLIPYLIATAKDLLKYKAVEYSIDTDVGSIRTTALIVAIANSTQYGLGARVAPTAVLDDGFLDLVVVEDRHLAGNVVRVPSVFLGSLHRKPGVLVSRVRRATVRSAGPMLFHVDGEAIQGGTELLARVHAGALRVRA